MVGTNQDDVVLKGDEAKKFQAWLEEQKRQTAPAPNSTPHQGDDDLRDKQDFTQYFERMFKNLEQEIMKQGSDTAKKLFAVDKLDTTDVVKKQRNFKRLCQAMVGRVPVGVAQSEMAEMEQMRQTCFERAHNEGTNADGLLAIPPVVNTDIFSAMQDYGAELADADTIPVTTNKYKFTPLLTTITFAETAELAAATHSQITIEQKEIDVIKFTGLTSFSDEILADTNPNFYQTIISCFSQAAARNRVNVMFYGSTNYDGIFDSTAAATGKTEVTLDGTTVASMKYSNLTSCPSSLPSKMLAGAKFYMHRTTYWDIIRNMTDDNNKPLFEAANAALNPTLLGFPVVFSEVITQQSSVAANTGFIAFGNLKNSAHFADRQQMDFLLSQHATVNSVNAFTQGAVGVRLSDRFGFLCYVPRFQADATQAGLVVIKTKAA